MTKSQGISQKMVAAVVVAIGVAIVWGMLGAWVVSMVESWLRPNDVIYEQVAVTRDGTPVIQSYSPQGFGEYTYRTLEGQSVEVGDDDVLRSAYLTAAARPARFFETPLAPLGWGQSLATSDFARPAGGWYLVRNNQRNDRAYFVGYDLFSRLPIGYLSRAGYSRGLPPESDWFEIGPANGYFGWATSTGYLNLNGPAQQYSVVADNGGLKQWLVFVVDGERIQEVNLRDRTVREVLTAANITSLAVLTEAVEPAENQQQQGNRDKAQARVAIRTHDRIIVLDPIKGEEREFMLPQSLLGERLAAYSLGPDQLLLSWRVDGDANRPSTERLTWIGRDGAITREESIQLAQNRVSAGPQAAVMAASIIAPIPLGWAVMLGLIVPVGMMNEYHAPTYAAALAEILDVARWGMVIVAVIACACAWLVWRWQKKYFRPATGAWCTFAFLLGAPGVIAYWLEMRRAKLEACGECQATVPRDRDACAGCGTVFPAPALVGKEIFA